MGTMCGGEPVSSKNSTTAPMAKPTAIMTNMEQKSTQGGSEPWRSLLLGEDVLVRNVHPHVLKKFKDATDEIPASARVHKSQGDKPSSA